MINSLTDVLKERIRQITEEGYTAEHDDEHAAEEIAAMAAYYAMPPGARDWPVGDLGYGPTLGCAIRPCGWRASAVDRRDELVKAGALIIAEIDRIDRSAEKSEAV